MSNDPERRLIHAWLDHNADLVEKFRNDAPFHALITKLAQVAVAVLVDDSDVQFEGYWESPEGLYKAMYGEIPNLHE